ncbi:hypothetical protein EVAR_98716_1 [Eumeta japonica]|uniref:Uncharacterized protein n=1 Tax=Eumeta variegata TaxID=151549 RepID=A0A4C1XWX9_EUMVA|nr:hypothetical protein EVAR_98716_1 [Eumeta japonica]
MSPEIVTGRFPFLLPGRERSAAAGWSMGAQVDDLTSGLTYSKSVMGVVDVIKAIKCRCKSVRWIEEIGVSEYWARVHHHRPNAHYVERALVAPRLFSFPTEHGSESCSVEKRILSHTRDVFSKVEIFIERDT